MSPCMELSPSPMPPSKSSKEQATDAVVSADDVDDSTGYTMGKQYDDVDDALFVRPASYCSDSGHHSSDEDSAGLSPMYTS